jgi:hypothetical protein
MHDLIFGKSKLIVRKILEWYWWIRKVLFQQLEQLQQE